MDQKLWVAIIFIFPSVRWPILHRQLAVPVCQKHVSGPSYSKVTPCLGVPQLYSYTTTNYAVVDGASSAITRIYSLGDDIFAPWRIWNNSVSLVQLHLISNISKPVHKCVAVMIFFLKTIGKQNQIPIAVCWNVMTDTQLDTQITLRCPFINIVQLRLGHG